MSFDNRFDWHPVTSVLAAAFEWPGERNWYIRRDRRLDEGPAEHGFFEDHTDTQGRIIHYTRAGAARKATALNQQNYRTKPATSPHPDFA